MKLGGGKSVSDKLLLSGGLAGWTMLALFEQTSVLTTAFDILGRSQWLSWSDFILLPALVVAAALVSRAATRILLLARACAIPRRRLTLAQS